MVVASLSVQPGGLNDRHRPALNGEDDVPVVRIDSVTAMAAENLALGHRLPRSHARVKDGAGEGFRFPGWVLDR